MPTRELRNELRRIPTARNVVTVALAIGQTFGVVGLAGYLHTWWAYLFAFTYMTRGHGCLNILAHEAAHRLLFANQRVNDFVGRWVVGYASLNAFGGYRRVHFAHHRDELGPNEPDLALYSGYPIPRDSWHRKLRRDAFGQSAYKNLHGLVLGVRAKNTEALRDSRLPARAPGSEHCGSASADVRRVAVVVVDHLEGIQSASIDRRTRRHGPIEGPPDDDPRHSPDLARPLLDCAVQHEVTTSPITSTWACRFATFPACTRNWWLRVGWHPRRSIPTIGRFGVRVHRARHAAVEGAGSGASSFLSFD
ncbi:MAG: fatty acid desaturase [Acidimicrobiales bacterium]